ncbi:MAG: GAF domain-containing protein [Anaerolineaceae bacterium]
MTTPDQAQRESEIARRLAEMATTSEVLVSAADLGEVLQALALRAQTVTEADYAAIATFDDDRHLTRFIYTGMSEEQARKLGNPPSGRGLLGELARRSKPIRVDRLREHSASSGWPATHPDMDAFLGVPICAGGRTIGSLYMTRVPGRPPFAETDEAAAAVLSLQAAVSVASAMHRERNGRVFLLEERVRIAHDLHDGTIQSLYALGLELDVATSLDVGPEVGEVIRASVQRINDLIADIRGYITMLETESPLAQPELSRDIAYVIRQLVPPGTDAVVNITAAALQELTARDSEDLLYIAREALSNAIRHGLPTKVAIDLRQSAEATSLTVQDNGVGFDQANARSGLGTVTMRTRAARLGAELTILGIPGMGTTVRISLPRRSDD